MPPSIRKTLRRLFPNRVSRFRPLVTELESRWVPTLYSVFLTSASEGVPGSTDAVHTGGLGMNSGDGGAALVDAPNPVDAIRAGLTGLVRVKYFGYAVAYPFAPSTAGTSAGQRLPYLVTAAGTSGKVAFEDLARFDHPGWEVPACDWDYNDRSWNVHVEEFIPGGRDPGGKGNHPPIAVDDTASAFFGIPLTIGVLNNDSDPDADPIKVVSVSSPSNGEVSRLVAK